MVTFSQIISTLDAHTAGEPARIVVSGVPPIPGHTMAKKKQYMRDRLDQIRTLVMCEPRGNKDMFGAVVVPPTIDHAHYGVLFMDPAGYVDMCGHGIIAITTVLLETGMIPAMEPEPTIVFDTPAGVVECRTEVKGNEVHAVSVANVPSFLWARDIGLSLPGGREIIIDIAFGGNFFAVVPAQALGIALRPENASQLAEYGSLIGDAVNDKIKVKHPRQEHIDTVEITVFYDIDVSRQFLKSVATRGSKVDRSPCGTGTSAILATLHGKGRLDKDREYTSESIIGTRFQGKLTTEVQLGEFTAVAPIITGEAHITGLHQFVVDPKDPLKYGFLLG
jgi:proline racemase